MRRARRPLKIGIHNDLRTALGGALTDAELSRALRVYVSKRVYRNKLVTEAVRIDLNGEPAGTVSAEHARAALPKPKPNDSNRSASRPAVSAPPAPPPSRPAIAAAVKRMSLADLREAAQRRKASQIP
jgi:ProP effector